MTSEDSATAEGGIPPTFVCSFFELANRADYFASRFNVRYNECDTGVCWPTTAPR